MNVNTTSTSPQEFVLPNVIDMSRKKVFLFLLIFFVSLKSQAQIEIVHHTIFNNDTSIQLLTQQKTQRAVIFFCPTRIIGKEVYFKKAEELNKSGKLKGLSDLTLYYIYYNQDTKNNAKGVKYVNSFHSDTMFIGQFECLFIGFDNKLLLRSKSKMKYNYDVTQIFRNENVWSVPIVDTNKCFEKLQDRIPFYADFIRESCIPIYSADEKIQFLRDTVENLSEELQRLKARFDTLQKSVMNLPKINGPAQNQTDSGPVNQRRGRKPVENSEISNGIKEEE
jgi:hypothetical protein